jgi:hypothetical protein
MVQDPADGDGVGDERLETTSVYKRVERDEVVGHAEEPAVV